MVLSHITTILGESKPYLEETRGSKPTALQIAAGYWRGRIETKREDKPSLERRATERCQQKQSRPVGDRSFEAVNEQEKGLLDKQCLG